MKLSVKNIVMFGVMAALICVVTMFPQVPVPATEGYIHMGDAMIFVGAYFLGPIGGMLSAGIGSALADLLSGYTHWILPTLLIKSLMGFVMGYLLLPKKGFKNFRKALAMVSAGILMVVGYFIAGSIIKGNMMVALSSVPFNILQFIVGMILAMLIISGLDSTNVKKYMR